MGRQQPDRRDLKQRQAIATQVRALLSSPSVLLTVDEAQRLLHLQREACQRILRRLLEAGCTLRDPARRIHADRPNQWPAHAMSCHVAPSSVVWNFEEVFQT